MGPNQQQVSSQFSHSLNRMPFFHPKVSIVMASYNCEQFIGEAIESILNQSLREFEFIIVDDGSTDRTVEIISSFDDERIILIQNDRNMGQTKSLNIGIKHSKAKYIARMDADDIAHHNRLRIQYDFLEKNSDIDCVGSWGLYINKKGNPIRLFKVPHDPLEIKCYLMGSGDLSFWPIIHPTVVMRKDALEKTGLYCEEKGEIRGYPQDYELWSRFLKRHKLANIPKPLLKYRIVKGSDSRATDQGQYRYEVSIKKIKNFLPDLEPKETHVLARMLEFRPQESIEDSRIVFKLFDRYFQAVMGENCRLKKIQSIQKKMKLYYLPRLAANNKSLALEEFKKAVFDTPANLLDIKLYRKVAKACLIK